MTEFHCNICATELSTEQIQIEKKHSIDVAYVDCPECDSRFNMMFDNRNTERIKNKIKRIKEMEHYLLIGEKLNHIGSGVDSIRVDMKVSERRITEISEQLIRTDESAKSAHKRIDKMDGPK